MIICTICSVTWLTDDCQVITNAGDYIWTWTWMRGFFTSRERAVECRKQHKSKTVEINKLKGKN